MCLSHWPIMRTKVSDVCQRIFSEVDTDCKFLSVFWSRSALPLIQQGTIKHSRSTIKHFVVDTQQFCQAIYDDALKAIIFFLYNYFSVRIFFCTIFGDDRKAITSWVVIDRLLFVSNRSFVSQQQWRCQILKKLLKVFTPMIFFFFTQQLYRKRYISCSHMPIYAKECY